MESIKLLNAVQYKSIQLITIHYSSGKLTTTQCSSLQLNEARWSSMQFNETQCSSIHLKRARALARPLGERSEPLQLQGLCCILFMQSVGRCHDMLRSVPKLLKFKARFPFFVRQVFTLTYEKGLLNICSYVKLLTYENPSGSPKWLQGDLYDHMLRLNIWSYVKASYVKIC